MTELQKLSFKKLRKKRLPLFVVDQKSKRKVFAIVEAESGEAKVPTKNVKKMPEDESIPDYRNRALLWDAPHLTNEKFHFLLKNPDEWEHPWAVRRLLEYAPSRLVTKIFSLSELREAFAKVRLRPIFQEAWSHAIRYWSENP